MNWIPVTERLPERAEGRDYSDPVLCFHPNGQQAIDYCYYEHQHKNYDYGAPKQPAFAQPYTHWQPLPPRPGAMAVDPTQVWHAHQHSPGDWSVARYGADKRIAAYLPDAHRLTAHEAKRRAAAANAGVAIPQIGQEKDHG